MLKQMEIISIETNTIQVVLAGNLYVEEATELRETFIQEIDRGIHNIHLNLSDLEYIDSSGLGVFIAIQKRCMQKGGSVKVKGLKGNIKELFELTRLTKVFEIED